MSASQNSNVDVGAEISEIFKSGKLETDHLLDDEEFENIAAEKLYAVAFPEGIQIIKI